MAFNDNSYDVNDQQQRSELNNNLERMAWGMFLVMLGGLWLVPAELLPDGTWLVGTGLILLGLNLARYLRGLEISTFTLILGGVGIVLGISDFLGVDLPIFPIVLIIIGASILLKPLFERNT